MIVKRKRYLADCCAVCYDATEIFNRDVVGSKNRGMQLKAVELILQAARIEARFRPALGERLGLPAMADIIEAKTVKPTVQ